MQKIPSNSDKITQNFGAKIAKLSLDRLKKNNKSISIFLKGELGSGKTTFAKGFLKYFGIKTRGASPTFVIMKRYSAKLKVVSSNRLIDFATYSPKLKVLHIYHIDFYRMRSKEDIKVFDIEKLSKEKGNIFLIEWPEKIGLKLNNKIEINFSYGEKENERVISVK